MKICVRRGTFETNSSSTHSIVVITEDEWEKLRKGLLYYNITHDWEDPDYFLVDPKTEEKLPVLVPVNMYDEISKYEKERHKREFGDDDDYDDDGDFFLSEQLINPNSREWRHADAEKAEDGKVRVDIEHFFG